MGASKSHRNLSKTTRRIDNIGARRADKLASDTGYADHRDDVASLEEARQRKLIVEQGIDPATNEMYPSIATHRDALAPYWNDLTNAEWAHIKSTIWHKINPHTGAILVHPSGRQLANA